MKFPNEFLSHVEGEMLSVFVLWDSFLLFPHMPNIRTCSRDLAQNFIICYILIHFWPIKILSSCFSQ